MCLQYLGDDDTLPAGCGLNVTRVIRNHKGLYFTSGGAWTTHFQDAERFSNIQSVIEASRHYDLKGVDLVLLIHEQPCEWDVVVRLSD
jgi:hypothetical protein